MLTTMDMEIVQLNMSSCEVIPPMGYVANDLDCNDDNNSINPDAIEICDGIDNNCNGMEDDGLVFYTYYLDVDNDGFWK